MILIIDNNDSFTYNLIDYIKTQTKLTVQVVGIDNLLIEDVINMKPKAIVICHLGRVIRMIILY